MSHFFLPTIVSADIRGDANQLAMALGESEADRETWSLAQWTKDGHEYATRNLWITQAWLESAQQPLTRPEWDADNRISMAGAKRAQAAIVIWDGEGDMPQPQPGKIVCIPGVDMAEVIEQAGLVLVETESE